jgi:hypothetical protein
MADNRQSTGALGIVLGAVVAFAALLFLLSGGEHFGKKTVEGDRDMPPVATGVTGTAPATETTGGPSGPSRRAVPPPAR